MQKRQFENSTVGSEHLPKRARYQDLCHEDFPFKKVYLTEMNRPWCKYQPKDLHACRISPFIEHLCFRSSVELGCILTIMLNKGSMSRLFVKTHLDLYGQRDLNPFKKPELLGHGLVKRLINLKQAIPEKKRTLDDLMVKWYADRYNIEYLQRMHPDDLLDILSSFLGDEPNGTKREFEVESAICELSASVKRARNKIRN